jgi:hypothetical protein
MADIGLNPPKAGILHARTGVMIDALAKFGSVLVYSGTSGHADMATTASAAAATVAGVVVSQGDPNNSGLFGIGDEVSVQDLGDCQILVLGGVTYARGDKLITTTTAGVAGKLGSTTGAMDIIGECLEDVTTGTNPQLISCRLNIQHAKPA